MRDPELVARARHAAARLESAWERWRELQDLANTPAQPVVGYVGYALKEPWGQPRAVIGFSADEAERLAEFLERGNAERQPRPRQPRQRQPRQRQSGQRQPDQRQPGQHQPAVAADQSTMAAREL